MIVLIDTNIVLDVIQRRQPHVVSAAQVWKLVEEGELTGYVSAITFNNLFYVLRKQIGIKDARDAVRLVRQSFKLVPLDEAIIDDAIASAERDFEDAIQTASAKRVGAAYIVTRNVADFASTAIPAVSPNDLLPILEP